MPNANSICMLQKMQPGKPYIDLFIGCDSLDVQFLGQRVIYRMFIVYTILLHWSLLATKVHYIKLLTLLIKSSSLLILINFAVFLIFVGSDTLIWHAVSKKKLYFDPIRNYIICIRCIITNIYCFFSFGKLKSIAQLGFN